MNKTSCDKKHIQAAQGGEPEWLRVTDVKRMFGISKPKIYLLIHEGKVRSAALLGPKKLRGTRLISLASLRAHIEAMADEQAKEVRP